MKLRPCCLLLAVLLCAQLSSGQTIQVRLLDGKSGQPIPNLLVTVFGGYKGELKVTPLNDAYDLDTAGVQRLQLGAIRHHADQLTEFSVCNKLKDPMLMPEVKDVIDKGVVSNNACGNIVRPVTPGVLVLFVRRTHWWEKLD